MNEDIEQHLERLHLVEPSAQLKKRVTSAAMSVWNQTSMDVAWWIPARRLSIAAAVALAIVWFSNYAGDRAATGWQFANVAKVNKPSLHLGGFDDATDALLAEHMTCLPRHIDVEAIRQYQEQVRRMLDEQG